ncbi:hypothetical protein IE81DRAFT_71885 [Ceraceosorus guamensis]|uniref:Uncharacterized protein n=1 Tax=Ceraceosorus guamensis TaxID=1522189 RepID=A0A316W196_9BASI|nr:hypothetical protein IE81DRAFT_71885 [Ceraceosorus guamensis]PWN43590.1 hypothetical protein IE81DRAFT_71885 [Ceraceosorus guamensis]
MGKDLSRKRRKFRHNDDAPNPNDSSDDGRAHSPDADVPAYAGDRDSGVRRRTIAEQARLSPSRGVERGSIWAVRKSQSPRRDHDSDSDGESEEEHRDVFHLDVPYVADDAEAIPTTETHPATLQEDDKPPLNEEEAAELQDLEEEEVVEYLRQKREKIRLDRIRQIEERDAREQAERAAAKEAREQAEKEKWKVSCSCDEKGIVEYLSMCCCPPWCGYATLYISERAMYAP